MKILLVSPIEVTPPISGASRRILDMGKALASLGNEVTILAISIASGLENRRPTVLMSEGNLKVVVTGLFRKTVWKHLVRSDIVQFEFPYFFFLIVLLKIFGRKCVLDAHDVEYCLSKDTELVDSERARAARSKKIPLLINRLLKRIPVIVFFVEMLAVRFSSFVFVCSRLDAATLSRIYKFPKRKVKVIPNSGRAVSYQGVREYSYDRPTIIFVGTFDHLPNVYGAKVLVEKIMPIVRRKIPNALCVVVGPYPPEFLVRNGLLEDSLLVTGEVDDVKPFIAGADVAVAPIYQGSGTRVKLIEYMHLGKPIVSTTKGAEGLDIRDNLHLLIRDDPSDFASAIVELMENVEMAKCFSMRCRELAQKLYSWEANGQMAEAIYRRILQTRILTV